MKIGIDGRVLMDKNYSGISSYTANLLSALLSVKQNHSFQIFCNSFSRKSNLSIWEKQGCQVIKTSYPNKIFNYLLQNIFSWPKLDKKLGGTDIFFAPHFNFLKLSKDTKLVLTVHDLSFLRYPEFFSSRKNFWHRALRIKKLLNRADKIVVVSQSTKHDLQELFKINSDKIEVIYSGNNYQLEALKRLKLEEEILFNNQQKFNDIFLQTKKISKDFILFLGNIEPRKNITGLIEAYNILRQNNEKSQEVQLVLAGGRGWKTKKILKTWRKSPFKNDIKFLGYVNSQEKEALYRQAKLFVYPSFYEGFGFPPLEAASFGIPVISSHVSSLPEILEAGALLINPFKPDELAEAMSLLLSDNSLRARFIKAGLERASQFSWDKTANLYLKLFEKLNENK